MRYTVTKLSKLSGVSSRTLRFYDEIGLLKPAFYGENQYRYYEEEQLLMLQQILFFRELGFPLSDIQRIISSDDFNKIEALNTHKSILQSSLERTETLIKTIDKTISHLRGKLIMRDAEMYDGFDPNKQQEHEKYMVNTGIITQQQIDDSWNNVRHWKKDNWEQFKQEGEQLNQELAKAMSNHLKPADIEVQALIQRHYSWVKNFWTPTKESYIGLAQMYLDHPDYREFYNKYHPNLVEYLIEAMGVFAERKLS
ncbi:TPA: MerR family transcriptional regulator [Legionella pneumophila]|nr:MerR family transcriptional regulator [Legionella pneumophila]HCJ1112924.1 MerR family transcriptional regulator [Legionella pneumophila]